MPFTNVFHTIYVSTLSLLLWSSLNTISFHFLALKNPNNFDQEKAVSIYIMRRSSDFEFWVEKLPEDHPNCDDSGDTEVEFQIQTQNEDHFEAYSSPLWTRPSRSFHHEAYTLLPSNHHYSSSPTSRLRAIANGRRELMEMIKDISESSYELSLKDIVEDKHRKEKEKSGKIVEERNSNKTETRNSRKSVTARRSQISRTQSMESGAFLLKIFLPIPQSSKKNSKARNCAKNSPGTSSERSEKQANKDWWKTIFSSVKDRNKKCINIRRSSSDITSSKTSLVDSNFMPRQLSLNSKKYKSSGQRGCLF